MKKGITSTKFSKSLYDYCGPVCIEWTPVGSATTDYGGSAATDGGAAAPAGGAATGSCEAERGRVTQYAMLWTPVVYG